jgi:hypothetical protein
VSQLENLIELIRTVNEVYFITAPERVRAAYILVDDIVELSLKTFLYEHTLSQREQCKADFQAARLLSSNSKSRTLESYFDGTTELADLVTKLNITEQAVRQRLAPYHHTPEQQANGKVEFAAAGLLPSLVEEQAFDDYFAGAINLTDFAAALGKPENELAQRLKSFGDLRHWSVNERDQHVGFYSVVTDVKALFPANSTESEMLEAILERHESRNRLYHDHHHTAWSVSDVRCLRAMCDLFDLLEMLFPDFNETLKAPQYKTVACQIGVLRLKLKSEEGQSDLVQPYKNALKQLQRDHVYDLYERSVEHSIVHTVSQDFFRALRSEYSDAVAKLELRVNELQEMMQDPRRKRRGHASEYTLKSQRLAMFRAELSEIEALLGTP